MAETSSLLGDESTAAQLLSTALKSLPSTPTTPTTITEPSFTIDPYMGRILRLIGQAHSSVNQAVSAEGLFVSAIEKLQRS